MDEVFLGAGLLLLLCIGVWLVVMEILPDKKRPGDVGTWRRVQQTSGSTINVLLIRECEGQETGRIPVASIDSSEEHWGDKLRDALVEADDRKATLESAEEQ